MISILPPSSSFALKEWATACLLLKEGRQIVIIRKGGIDAADRDFTSDLTVESEFLLFPTYEHQDKALIKNQFHTDLLNTIEENDVPGLINLSAFAKITHRFEVESTESLNTISRFHIWNETYTEKRINWKPAKPAVVALLRVYPLIQPQALPVLPEYGNCKSIVDLCQEVPMGELEPIIPNIEYDSISQEISELLNS
ncbi:MAG: hypothetical protein DK302_001149 [Chloroflexi bacterium]|nr:MAG: hypothetical protein DK302_001149 [Chloroflexota bacterium]